ncbi:hypothetical protein BHM03_00006075 [Ensete ventricosum]|uniref:Uncharacterized protein n=1 Tax=Ensete ventricosum TaxID=4639 RepID=A0A445MBG3_ENSVE|nr:hypothetical protein BHM03_00006075 [Ensete ventricosum]
MTLAGKEATTDDRGGGVLAAFQAVERLDLQDQGCSAGRGDCVVQISGRKAGGDQGRGALYKGGRRRRKKRRKVQGIGRGSDATEVEIEVEDGLG